MYTSNVVLNIFPNICNASIVLSQIDVAGNFCFFVGASSRCTFLEKVRIIGTKRFSQAMIHKRKN